VDSTTDRVARDPIPLAPTLVREAERLPQRQGDQQYRRGRQPQAPVPSLEPESVRNLEVVRSLRRDAAMPVGSTRAGVIQEPDATKSPVTTGPDQPMLLQPRPRVRDRHSRARSVRQTNGSRPDPAWHCYVVGIYACQCVRHQVQLERTIAVRSHEPGEWARSAAGNASLKEATSDRNEVASATPLRQQHRRHRIPSRLIRHVAPVSLCGVAREA
jgi:hypothetical protein